MRLGSHRYSEPPEIRNVSIIPRLLRVTRVYVSVTEVHTIVLGKDGGDHHGPPRHLEGRAFP